MTHRFDCHFINGKWTPSTGDAKIKVENPATREIFATVPDGTIEDVDRAVAAAKAAQPAWEKVPMAERVALMRRVIDYLKARADEITELEVKELGAPVTFTRNLHVNYPIARIVSFTDLAEKLPDHYDFPESTCTREPVGVVACITPWNYPLGQVVQKVPPALLMGNTCVLKASQHTPLTAYFLAEAFEAAGLPPGVFNLVSGRGRSLGDRLATHPDVEMVSFTGSTTVGSMLGQKGLASLKRPHLELGGKSPFVFLPGIENLEPAVKKLFDSIFLNAGQTCTALSRLLVPEAEFDRITKELLRQIPNYRTGDPTDAKTAVGPLSSLAQYRKVRSYLELGLEEGATLLAGAVPPEEPETGYFIEPTIFTNVNNDMRIAREEIFGPVLCVLTYKTLDEAAAIANDTVYGLNAAVWGKKDEAVAMAKRIRAGNVYVNDGPRDITAPFGGMKASGLGREGGPEGLFAFTEWRAVFDKGVL